MLNKKTIVAALACAGFAMGAWSGTALATTVHADGIHWDTSSPLNLKIQGDSLRETSVSKVGDTLTGYGRISKINDLTASQFCTGCSLTFTFSYKVKDITGNQVVFDDGSLNFYADADGTFDETDPSTAGVGQLWLSMTGHTAKYQDYATNGQLFAFASGSVAEPGSQSSGFGMLDVSGGDASQYVMKNVYADGLGGFSDVKLTTEFASQPADICGIIDGGTVSHCYPVAGSGTMLNRVQAVPEPGELGLLGLGLGGLGFFLWRRRNERISHE